MYQKDKTALANLLPLPRGRHGLNLNTLRATRRARLIQAMLDLVSQHGYAATTVPEVVARARVSRNAFYEFFSDKEDCFLSAMDEAARGLLGEAMAYVPARDKSSADVRSKVASKKLPSWNSVLRGGLRNYLRWWQERPELSRAYFVQMPMVGERAVQQRLRGYQPFVKMFADLAAWMRLQDPALPSIPERAPLMLAVAVTEIIADEVRLGRHGLLNDLEDDLMYLIVNLLAGTAAKPH